VLTHSQGELVSTETGFSGQTTQTLLQSVALPTGLQLESELSRKQEGIATVFDDLVLNRCREVAPVDHQAALSEFLLHKRVGEVDCRRRKSKDCVSILGQPHLAFSATGHTLAEAVTCLEKGFCEVQAPHLFGPVHFAENLSHLQHWGLVEGRAVKVKSDSFEFRCELLTQNCFVLKNVQASDVHCLNF